MTDGIADGVARLSAALADRYRIERELGAGGMATVYLARDLKHDRDVAIKVLHPDLGAALGGERFLAEIKTTAKLQHPHILPLLDSGQLGGHPERSEGSAFLFYVMPLVEGETLRARLERERQLPIDDAIRIASETAGALDYAHRHGVIHRDIKPENILLHDGRAVVADFGIALAVSAASGPRMTQTGLSLGTPQYMSPEQAMGERQIDGRADVYALGAVLYEMLTGEPPFTGATVQAIVAKVLTERPMNPTAVRDTIPRHVEATVLKALAKLPADRFTSPAELADALAHPEIMSRTLQAQPSSTSTHDVRRHVTASPVMWAVLAVTAAVAAFGWLRRDSRSPAPPLAVPLATASGVDLKGALGSLQFSLSSDGSLMAFAGTDSAGGIKLFVRSLNDASAGLTIASPNAGISAFSPDGKSLAFFSASEQRVSVYQLSARAARPLGSARLFRGLTWTDDSTIVFGSEGKLRRWRLNSRESELLAEDPTGGDSFASPVTISADLVLFDVAAKGGGSELATLSLHDKHATRLGITGAKPGYVAGGIVTYLNDGALWGVQFDPSTMKVRSQPTIIAAPSAGANVTAYAVSPNGVLVVARGAAGDRELVLVDRAGTARLLLSERRLYRWPRFSPDGKRIAVSVLPAPGPTSGDLWLVGVNGAAPEANTLTRLTADSSSTEAEWDVDGKSLFFMWHPGPRQPGRLARIAADGSGQRSELIVRPNNMYEVATTPDRRTIVWREDAPGAARDILMASVDSPTVAHPVRTGPFDERGFALSPDGRWLAYTSNETGTNEVYLCRLEPNGAHWRVSRRGGGEPRWARTGELFYRNADSVFATRVALGAEPTVGAPTLLFIGKNYSGSPYEPLWDVSQDGRQFVMVREREGLGAKVTIMVNWIDGWRTGQGGK